MLQTRVIPCLLLKDGGLVKTQKFDKPKYLGDPINVAKIFNKKEVDELLFIDITASKEQREPDWEIIQDLASECFMPLAYGGGIRTFSQIEKLLKMGVEKVIINNTALHDIDFVADAANRFGTSTIVCAIDVKKNFFGKITVYDHVSKKNIDLSPAEYAKKLEDHGAGEIFLNNVDRDGTYKGFDTELIKNMSDQLSVPLIVCGGASQLDDIAAASHAGASAIAAGSIFVFHGPHRAVLISYPSQKEIRLSLSY